MWFTKSRFSHCYVVQEGPQGKYVLEATARGVSLQTYTVFLNDHAIVEKEYVVDHDSDLLRQAWDMICENRLNRPYSYLQILGDAFVITMQTLFKRSLPNPFSERKADVCSELVLGWLRRAKIVGFENLVAATVSPEDIHRIVVEDEQFKILLQEE